MNKHILKAIFCAAMALPVFTSCELDQFPTDSLTEKESWKSYSDAVNQYNGLLAALRADIGGANAYVGDVQTDLFNQRLTSSQLSDINDWSFTGSQFSGDVVWANNYAVILQANFILQNIGKFDNDESLTARQRANIANIKATSYFARAYAYSSMLPYYCKDYEPETAKQELGLPIVEEVSSEARPSRATLQETCDTIIHYMDCAKQEFDKVGEYNKTATSSNKITATTAVPDSDAVTALRARHYLYMHKYAEAIKEAEKIQESYPLVQGNDNLLELWLFDSGNEIVYQPVQTPDEVTNTYGIYLSFNIVMENLTQDLKGMNPDYIPTQNLLDLYSNNDYRRSIYFSHKTNGENSMYIAPGTPSGYGLNDLYGDAGYTTDIISTSGQTVDGVIFTKFAGNPLLRKQGYWFSEIYNMSKAFRSAEAYLIIAEASIRLGDEEKAREELNLLRESRFDHYSDSEDNTDFIREDVTGEALEKVMEDEWTREFVGEGYRFACLKRWHKGFQRTPQHFDAPVLVATGGVQTLKVNANNIRFTWPIPQQDMQSNKNLKQNEGY